MFDFTISIKIRFGNNADQSNIMMSLCSFHSGQILFRRSFISLHLFCVHCKTFQKFSINIYGIWYLFSQHLIFLLVETKQCWTWVFGKESMARKKFAPWRWHLNLWLTFFDCHQLFFKWFEVTHLSCKRLFIASITI